MRSHRTCRSGTARPSGCPDPAKNGYCALHDALTTILGSMDVIVYVSDLETYDLLYVNEHFERLFGRDWRGRRCFEVLQSGQTRPCDFCTNDRLVREGVAQGPYAWEFRNTVNRRWYEIVDRAIPWVDGRLVRLEIAMDITARKDAELFRKQYLGLIVHDMRSPLIAIGVTAQVLQMHLSKRGLAPELGEVEQLLGNVGRMNRIIDGLLESARLETGIELHRRPLDLTALLTRLRRLRPLDEQRRISIHAAAGPLWAPGDESLLERVIDNLISNALTYSARGSPVVLKLVRARRAAEISVTDKGVGIEPAYVDQVFERFFRVPGSPAGGLGLGLYIARLIVEAHGGKLDVASRPGTGSRFRFTLPLDAAAVERPVARAGTSPAPAVGAA
jgi:two-component system, OmpR family, phosphate regulon sensor histidine kinase PhoR